MKTYFRRLEADDSDCHLRAEVNLNVNGKQFQVFQSLQLYLKETPTQVFSCGFCESFKNVFFTKYPPSDSFVLN